jgi:type I site-specific restriction endonuclease
MKNKEEIRALARILQESIKESKRQKKTLHKCGYDDKARQIIQVLEAREAETKGYNKRK